MRIGQRRIGNGAPVYFVAEISANHNQSFDRAVEIIRAAKDAGADAVKFQTYTADTLTIKSDQQWFKIERGSLWSGKTLYELYGEAYTPWEWHSDLQSTAHGLGLDFFSTPFDETAVTFLDRLNVPAYKVASFEIVDLPLLRLIAKTGKPVIVSTGMASLADIEEAIATLRENGADQITLLKCTSAYPASPSEMHLRTIPHLGETFGVPIGLSDHTLGIAVPIAAVALGACLIEKHLTLSRESPSPDSAFSLEPDEFKMMVDAIRVAEQALGEVRYEPSTGEKQNRSYRRSLFIVADMVAGEKFTLGNVRSIRPGHGLHPRYLSLVLGRSAKCSVKRGTPLSWEVVGN